MEIFRDINERSTKGKDVHMPILSTVEDCETEGERRLLEFGLLDFCHQKVEFALEAIDICTE